MTGEMTSEKVAFRAVSQCSAYGDVRMETCLRVNDLWQIRQTKPGASWTALCRCKCSFLRKRLPQWHTCSAVAAVVDADAEMDGDLDDIIDESRFNSVTSCFLALLSFRGPFNQVGNGMWSESEQDDVAEYKGRSECEWDFVIRLKWEKTGATATA